MTLSPEQLQYCHYNSKPLPNRNAISTNPLNGGRCISYDWFKKFRRGQFNFNDQPKSGQPLLIGNGHLCVCVIHTRHH